MAPLRILGPIGNIHVNLALITADFLGVPLKHIPVEHKEATGKEFVKKYPLGLIPILLTQEDEVILTPVAILKFIARTGNGLLGQHPLDESKIDQFIDIILGGLHSAYDEITTSIYGYRIYDEKSVKNSKKNFAKFLSFLNNALKIDTYLAGQELSIADIALAAVLHRTFKLSFDDKFRSEYPHAIRHLKYISNIPLFQNYFGRFVTVTADWEPSNHENSKKTVPAPQVQEVKAAKPESAPKAKPEKQENQKPKEKQQPKENKKEQKLASQPEAASNA